MKAHRVSIHEGPEVVVVQTGADGGGILFAITGPGVIAREDICITYLPKPTVRLTTTQSSQRDGDPAKPTPGNY